MGKSCFCVSENHIIGIKHGFSCINIRQVPWEVLKTEAEGRGFQHLPRDLENINAKRMFDRYYCIKPENICYISRFFLHCFAFSQMSRERTMLVLGQGSIHLVTAAILWPRYEHIKSYVAVH